MRKSNGSDSKIHRADSKPLALQRGERCGSGMIIRQYVAQLIFAEQTLEPAIRSDLQLHLASCGDLCEPTSQVLLKTDDSGTYSFAIRHSSKSTCQSLECFPGFSVQKRNDVGIQDNQ